MHIQPLSEHALLLTFGQTIDPTINDLVLAYEKAIKSELGVRVKFLIPAFASLTVGFDPLAVNRGELSQMIADLQVDPHPAVGRSLHVPVCYHPEFAQDLEEIASIAQISPDEVIALHTHAEYRVYMLGFVPGFVYMGILPDEIQLPRRSEPRLEVPAGAVAIAGLQTGIYPGLTPGGWHILGRTPVPALTDSLKSPSPYRVGDRIRFRHIERDEFLRLERQIEKGLDALSLIER